MSIYAIPSTSFQAVMTGAPTGLVVSSGVTVQVINSSTGAVAIAETSSGITENPASSGIYIATLTAPSSNGEYVVVWKVTVGTTVTRTAEELFVTGTPPSPTTATSGSQPSMNLLALRTEVLNHGFDGSIYTATRLNQYLNDAMSELSSKALYYGEEQETNGLTMTAGTDHYSFPTDISKLRSVRITTPIQELAMIDLRDIDRSQVTSGIPYAYAIDGQGITVYPTPDTNYPYSIRYWQILSPMTVDTDVPGLPPRYHRSLTYYAIARCFEGEDDPQQAQYYDAKWQQTIKDLKADLVFPLTDGPRQVRSQWDAGPVKPGWGFWP